MGKMSQQLNRYHRKAGITPVAFEQSYHARFRAFECPHKSDCKATCRKAFRKEGQPGSFAFSPPVEGQGQFPDVRPHYENWEYDGTPIPRIVVISLSVPQPYLPAKNGEEGALQGRMKPRSHWPETLAMVRSMIHPTFLSLKELAKPVSHWEDENRSMLETLFVHVRAGKCCSNFHGNGMEPYRVYGNCGGYLRREIEILQPDVIVTQGNPARWETEKHVLEEGAGGADAEKVRGIDDSIARLVSLRGESRRVYWLRSYFPVARNWDRYLKHAGPPEKDEVGAKRRNFTLYGRAIKKLFDSSVLGPDA